MLATAVRVFAAASALFLFLGLLLPYSPAPSLLMVLCTYGLAFTAALVSLVGYRECRESGQSIGRVSAITAVGVILVCVVDLFPAFIR